MFLARIRGFTTVALQHLRDLNLFHSHASHTDEHEVHSQRLATRLFILLLMASLIVLLVYTSTTTVDKTTTIYSPSLEQYNQLHEKYAQTLTCPCSNIAIAYDKFLDIRYRFHQICSSDFVSYEWLKLFYYIRSTMVVNLEDFRMVGQYAFQTLQSICELLDDMINNSLTRFNQMFYISANVIPSILFQSQANSLVKQFQSTTTKEFLSSLRIVRDTTQANALFSFLQSNAEMSFSATTIWGTTSFKIYNNCLCSKVATCISPMCFYDRVDLTVLYVVPGMYIGCYVFEALLQSDLRCFYNETCLQQLLFYMDYTDTVNVVAMNRSAASHFLLTATVGEMLDELMVEEWQWAAAYNRYFNECQPVYCSYTRSMRNDAIYIVTATISLVGGLVTVLRLLVPRFVRLVRIKHRQQSLLRAETATHVLTIRKLWQMRTRLYRFNLFPSNPPTTDEATLRQQRFSTHVFISLFVSSLIVLLVYTSTVTVTKTATVDSPTLSQYVQLYEKHAQTLTCPCSNIAIDYGDFFTIDYNFHAVCQSDFITDKWFDYLYESWGDRSLFVRDFRVTSSPTFRALRSVCILVNTTISNSLIRFYATKYVSTEATTMALFHSQMESAMSSFQLSTIKEFLSSLRLIRETTQSNSLFSAGQTDAQLVLFPNMDQVSLLFQHYGNCDCALSSTCLVVSSIYNEARTQAVFTVPGLYTGCYVVEALLQSNLQCFHSESCLQALMTSLPDSNFVNITTMSPSTNKHFTVNSTVEDLLDELMVDEWRWSAEYERYFNSCQPLHCSYTEQTRNDAIYIITALIGLVGGLVKALRLLVPHSVLLIKRILLRNGNGDSPRHRLTLNSIRQPLQHLKHLNLFRSTPTATTERDLHMQMHSTRLFVCLLFLSLTILLIYTSTIPVTKTSIIKSPSLALYTQLYTRHASTLVCPCTYVAVEHEKYLRVNYTLHPICISDFIADQWINFLYLTWYKFLMREIDFRTRGVFAFKALDSFCRLVDETITNSLIRFYTDRYISMAVSSSSLFQLQMNALATEFETSTIREFISSLQIVREYTHSNTLYSVLRTSGIAYYSLQSRAANLLFNVYNGTCGCGSSPRCIETAAIYDVIINQIVYTIPGFYIGCYVIEALLQSNLQCFYNATCVQQLIRSVDPTSTVNVTAMIASPTSRFLPTNSVEEILNELMVDRWQWSVDYERYYNECQPIQCSYTESRRNDLIYIVTTLIGLVGGLVTALRLTVPRAVFVFYYLFKSEATVAPTIFIVADQVKDGIPEIEAETIK